MPATLPPVEVERTPLRERAPQTLPTTGGGGLPPRDRGQKGWGGGDSGGGGDFGAGQRYKLAVWVGIAGIVMFFAAITSAMIVRRLGADWRRLELPEALWVSTALLLASSVTFEMAKQQLRGGTLELLRKWITVTAFLGLGFLGAQLTGWLQLVSRGITMGPHTSGSFFYILTAAHGAHVAGGLFALAYVLWRCWSPRRWPNRAPVVEAVALYWHFMDVLWLYLLLLLSFWG